MTAFAVLRLELLGPDSGQQQVSSVMRCVSFLMDSTSHSEVSHIFNGALNISERCIASFVAYS